MNDEWNERFLLRMNDVEIRLENFCVDMEWDQTFYNMIQAAGTEYENTAVVIENIFNEKESKLYQLKRLTSKFMFG